MRALQYFPTIEDPSTRRSLFEVFSPVKDARLLQTYHLFVHARKKESGVKSQNSFHFIQLGFATDIDGN